MAKEIIIAIDGYSSCGKSTTAKAVAKQLGYVFIDTGAMYRAVTLFLIRHEIDVNDRPTVLAALPNIHITFQYNDELQRSETFLNGENVDQAIRSMEVSSLVSPVSTIKEVREMLVAQQRKMGQQGGIVMDGRDIGTVVFPQAELKVFMTAQFDTRVNRRLEELQSKGMDTSREEVAENLAERDRIDTTRDESPLRMADDAIEIDNTYLTPQQQLDLVLKYAGEMIAD